MKSICLLYISVVYFTTGEGLECYSCEYPPNSGCSYPFNKTATGVENRTCLIGGGHHCTVVVIRNGSTIKSAYRSCDGVFNYGQSNEHRVSLGGGLIRTTYTCYGNLCNGASSTTAATSTLIALTILYIYIYSGCSIGNING